MNNPANPAGDVEQPDPRQLVEAWAHVAIALLDGDIDHLVALRALCEQHGSFDQVNRISAGLDQLTEARQALQEAIQEAQQPS